MIPNALSASTELSYAQKHYQAKYADEDGVYYPSTIENYMPESNIHFALIMTLAMMMEIFLRDRPGSYVFGDIMFYYEKGNPQKLVAPDLMVCLDKEKEPSKGVYKLWEENSVPAFVLELASKTTWYKDVSTKVTLYQNLGVKEYFVFDPEYQYLPVPLMAFRMIEGVLVEQEVLDGRVYSETLKLEFVDDGKTLRLFDPKKGEFLMKALEIIAEYEAAKANAEAAKVNAEAAKANAEEIQAENERLKAELARFKPSN